MLGTLTSLLSGHCECESCRIMYRLGYEATCRRWQHAAESGVMPPWDDDLSEADIEVLTGAGWTAAAVREHVETLQKMVAALTLSRLPCPRLSP